MTALDEDSFHMSNILRLCRIFTTSKIQQSAKCQSTEILVQAVIPNLFQITREMQDIMGQASDFELGGQLSVFFERLSQRSTELSCARFDEERSRKSKAINEQHCGTVFLREHISPRTSSTVVQVQVVRTHVGGHARTGFVLDTACACQ